MTNALSVAGLMPSPGRTPELVADEITIIRDALGELAELLRLAPDNETVRFTYERFAARLSWLITARFTQLPPEEDHTYWLFLGGRGTGKTRTGAEWVSDMAMSHPNLRALVVAPVASDLRDVCFQGESGLIANIPDYCILDYKASYNQLFLKNGSRIDGFAAESADRIRGNQGHIAWCEELRSWGGPRNGMEAWDNLDMAVRLKKVGKKGEEYDIETKFVITTTPLPTPLLVNTIMKNPDTIITQGTTFDNLDNLPKGFVDRMMKIKDTPMGQQELMAKILDLGNVAPFPKDKWKIWGGNRLLGAATKCVISYDTAYKVGKENDTTACVVGLVHEIEEDVRKPHELRPDVIVTTKRKVKVVFIMDFWKERLLYPDLRKKMQDTYNYWEEKLADYIKPSEDPYPVMNLIEEAASGHGLIVELQRAGVPTVAWPVGKDSKVQRAHLASDVFLGGRCYVFGAREKGQRLRSETKPAQYAVDLIERLSEFVGQGDKAGGDDEVDAFSQLLRFLRDTGVITLDTDVRLPQFAEDDEDELEPVTDEMEGALYG